MMKRSRRGSAMVLGIIVAVIVTALVIAMSFVAGETSLRTGSLSKSDQAFFAAEAGAQRVIWYCKNGQMASITSPLTGTVNGFSYSTSWTTVSGSTISITSVATGGSTSYSLSQTVTPPSPAVSVPAMNAGGNNGNISGTVVVTGDLQTKRDINGASKLTVTGNLTIGAALNGSPKVGGNLKVNGDCNGTPQVGGNMTVTGNVNSSPTVTGNLMVNGVIWGNPTFGGTKTTGQSNTVTVDAPPNVTTIYNSLKATAGVTFNSPSSITTLDFTASPNGVIHINGDVNISSTCTVIGTGTVVVKGNWNQSSRFPASGTANVNVVVKGDLNISGGIYLNGSLYSGNNWNQSGGFAVNGCVVITNDQNVSGNGTITAANPPSFDPRATSGGGGGSGGTSTTTITKFTGPQP